MPYLIGRLLGARADEVHPCPPTPSNQLLVERYAVHKINKVQYPLPQNTVTVELTNSWWFGPVRLDPVAPEPRLGSPLRTTLNQSVLEQRFHAPFYGGSRSSRNANRSTHWRNGAVGLAHFLTIRPSRAHCTTVTAT
jgi:hypothetical protein